MAEKDYKPFSERFEENLAKRKFYTFINKIFPNGFGGWNSYYLLFHPWKIVIECCRQLKWAWQRVFRGWDDRASWNADSYFAEQISEIVGYLREHKISHPMVIYPDSYKLGDENEMLDKEMVQKWDNILKEISEGFSLCEDACDCIYGVDEEKEETIKFNHAFDLFRKYFVDLWD